MICKTANIWKSHTLNGGIIVLAIGAIVGMAFLVFVAALMEQARING